MSDYTIATASGSVIAEVRHVDMTAKPDRIEVDDVFENSWGYDQTNIDYYQVVAVTAKAVKLRQIAAGHVEGSDGFMSDRCGPVRNVFISDEVLTKFPRLSTYGSEPEWHVNFKYGGSTLIRGADADTVESRRSWYA